MSRKHSAFSPKIHGWQTGRYIHDAGLREIYQKLRPLLAPPPEQLKPEIGFHVKEDATPYRIRRKTSPPS